MLSRCSLPHANWATACSFDADFRPYPDQWQFLAAIRRLGAEAAEEIVADAQRKGDLIAVRMSIANDEAVQDPWTLPPSRKRKESPIEGPLPKTVQIIRANLVYVEKKDLPPAMLNRLLRLAAFQNPEFYKAQAMRLATYDKPRVIACGQEFPLHIAVPRGCLTEVLALLGANKVRPDVRDERYIGTAIDAEFQGQLTEHICRICWSSPAPTLECISNWRRLLTRTAQIKLKEWRGSY